MEPSPGIYGTKAMEPEVNRGNQEPLRWNQEVNQGYQVPSPANHGIRPREAEVSPGNQ